MAGNVFEWVEDWYSYSYYATSPSHDPSGPASGTDHVLRGGGFWGFAEQQRVAARYQGGWLVGFLRGGTGIRCAVAP